MSIGSPPHNGFPAGTLGEMEITPRQRELKENCPARMGSFVKEETPRRIRIKTDGRGWWEVRPAVPAQFC